MSLKIKRASSRQTAGQEEPNHNKTISKENKANSDLSLFLRIKQKIIEGHNEKACPFCCTFHCGDIEEHAVAIARQRCNMWRRSLY